MDRARSRSDFDRTTSVNVGTVNADGVRAEEFGDGINHQTVLSLRGVLITVGNTTAISFGNKKLWTFPKGLIAIKSVLLKDLSVGLDNAGNATPITGAMGGDVSLGSTGTADSTLATTDVNLLPSTSIDPISDGIASAILAAGVILNGLATAIPVYLNMIIDDADVADGASDVLEITATIVINWEFGGKL